MIATRADARTPTTVSVVSDGLKCVTFQNEPIAGGSVTTHWSEGIEGARRKRSAKRRYSIVFLISSATITHGGIENKTSRSTR